MLTRIEYSSARACLASAIEFMVALVGSMSKVGFNGAHALETLEDHRMMSKNFDGIPFEMLDTARFESELSSIGSFWADTRESLNVFLRSAWLVRYSKDRIEAVADSLGSEAVYGLRIQIRAYADGKGKESFAYLCSQIMAFDRSITLLEEMADAKRAKLAMKPAPAVSARRNRKADRSEADRQRRNAMKGSSQAVPLHGNGGKPGKNKKSRELQAVA